MLVTLFGTIWWLAFSITTSGGLETDELRSQAECLQMFLRKGPWLLLARAHMHRRCTTPRSFAEGLTCPTQHLAVYTAAANSAGTPRSQERGAVVGLAWASWACFLLSLGLATYLYR